MDPHLLPHMLYANNNGTIFEHPFYRMAACSGRHPVAIKEDDLIQVTEFSKFFFLPECPPIGLDPETGRYEMVPEVLHRGSRETCHAVSVFLEPGIVRSHLPASAYDSKTYTLPSWAYTAVGFRDDHYWASAFRIEYNEKWDPRNYDDKWLMPAISDYTEKHRTGRLVEHLIRCASQNHCFAAKNLFLKRWECPLPVSRTCNAACLGCLSLQPDSSCEASHQRISFRPQLDELVDLAVGHLEEAPAPIVSFGQGCEGEPLTEVDLIVEGIREIRKRTGEGTINLNTNGSRPDRVLRIARSGLDSIRISLNSARPELYHAYYRPKDYGYEDVVESIAVSRSSGLYTMINYLVFPGITDQEPEIAAFKELIEKTGVQFVHLKNLCIDPDLYLRSMPQGGEPGIGMDEMLHRMQASFPGLEFGYFNQTVR
jgi:pyruvate-formate lyase-activating enzyme